MGYFTEHHFLEDIRNDPVDQVLSRVLYFLWESSTGTMSRLGLPSNPEVMQWKNIFLARTDVPDYVRKQFVRLCDDYLAA